MRFWPDLSSGLGQPKIEKSILEIANIINNYLSLLEKFDAWQYRGADMQEHHRNKKAGYQTVPGLSLRCAETPYLAAGAGCAGAAGAAGAGR